MYALERQMAQLDDEEEKLEGEMEEISQALVEEATTRKAADATEVTRALRYLMTDPVVARTSTLPE
eukprot:763627-Hanusia_phi.AAC.8